MNIEEAIKICKQAKKPMYHEVVGSEWIKGYTSMLGTDLDEAIETLLTAYEKEKEKNKKYIVQLTDEQYRKLVDIIRHKTSKEYEDKIKAKIEEIDEILNNNILIEKLKVYYEAQKEVLQSLLESLLEKE